MGEVVEQGSFTELNVPGKYTYGLQVKIEHAFADSENVNDATISDDTSEAAPTTEDNASDESRKAGDWTVYKYYVQALGPIRLSIFVLLAVSHSVVNAMGSKSRRTLAKLETLLIIHRCLG